MTHPLHHDLLGLGVRTTVPEGGAWTRFADLAGGDFGVHLERASRLHGGCDGPVARAAAGGLLVGDVASALAVPMVSALIGQRRAILLDPATTWLESHDDEGIGALAAVGARVAVLADDVLTGTPGTVTVADVGELRAVATASFAAMMTPLVTTGARSIRRGRRTLWAETAERLGAAVLMVLRRLDRIMEAPDEAQALLDAGPPVLRQQLQWVDVPVGDDSVPWKRRVVCCLAYQTPNLARQYCATCPLTPCHKTVSSMSTWLTQNA